MPPQEQVEIEQRHMRAVNKFMLTACRALKYAVKDGLHLREIVASQVHSLLDSSNMTIDSTENLVAQVQNQLGIFCIKLDGLAEALTGAQNGSGSQARANADMLRYSALADITNIIINVGTTHRNTLDCGPTVIVTAALQALSDDSAGLTEQQQRILLFFDHDFYKS